MQTTPEIDKAWKRLTVASFETVRPDTSACRQS